MTDDKKQGGNDGQGCGCGGGGKSCCAEGDRKRCCETVTDTVAETQAPDVSKDGKRVTRCAGGDD